MQKRLMEKKNIEIVWDTEVKEINGDIKKNNYTQLLHYIPKKIKNQIWKLMDSLLRSDIVQRQNYLKNLSKWMMKVIF